MNLESRLKVELVEQCRTLGAYARRHEDRFAVGLLDLAIKFPERPHLLAEAKVIEHQQFAPTLRQFEEGVRYLKAGGACALIGWDKKTRAMFIHHWAKTATKEQSFTLADHPQEYAVALLKWLEDATRSRPS